jgi:uncharacterized protein (DUF1697 family)
MTRYVALPRGVNVGGTGKLPMAELQSMCKSAGFLGAETYIASGNVVFKSNAAPSRVKGPARNPLACVFRQTLGVVVRTASELLAVFKANPFPAAEPKHTYVIFLDERPPRDALAHAVGQSEEQMALGDREIFIHYGNGMGRSKLRIPAARPGTARNITLLRNWSRWQPGLDPVGRPTSPSHPRVSRRRSGS